MTSLDAPCFVRGTIGSAGFAGGHRFVIGCWPTSPIGPFGDVMSIGPDGKRALIVPHSTAADFVTAIYRFDETVIADLDVACDGRTTRATTSWLRIEVAGGRARWLPARRPLSFTRFIEQPNAVRPRRERRLQRPAEKTLDRVGSCSDPPSLRAARSID